MAVSGADRKTDGGGSVTVVGRTVTAELAVSPGMSLLDLLIASDIRLPVHCGGHGACGNCKIRVDGGVAAPGTAAERHHLTEVERAGGVRLACRVSAEKGLTVTVLDEPDAPDRHWIDPGSLPAAAGPGPAVLRPEGGPLGVAVDFGTTQIRISLWDRAAGRRLGAMARLNPQTRYGADILQRLLAAGTSVAAAERMARLGSHAIRDGLAEMGAALRVDTRRIGAVTVVGNTAMLTLLGKRGPERLLQPRNWLREIDCRPDDPGALLGAWGVHRRAELTVVPAVAGFVGSDLVAAVLAAGLHRGRRCALLVDFGTNSEMALWDGRRFWVASAAGGPAFDGCGIGCGMPAGPGAVHRFFKAPGDAAPRHEAFDPPPPRGICGSGLVDAIAMLRREGLLGVSGRFAAGVGAAGVALVDGCPAIRLKARDVDAFQRAKAAVGAGVAGLMAAAGVTAADLEHVFVCGAFGGHLDVANAQAVGLLPAIPPRRFRMLANAALTGCEGLMLAADGDAAVSGVKGLTRMVSLADNPFFDRAFPEHLLLRPTGPTGPAAGGRQPRDRRNGGTQ